MSAEQFQQRLSDLIFSAKEHIKELEAEQTQSANDHSDWESEAEGLNEGNEDELAEHEADEPEVIDNFSKITAIEAAVGYLEAAVDELDKALADD